MSQNKSIQNNILMNAMFLYYSHFCIMGSQCVCFVSEIQIPYAFQLTFEGNFWNHNMKIVTEDWAYTANV
jgi:hypothetical protein